MKYTLLLFFISFVSNLAALLSQIFLNPLLFSPMELETFYSIYTSPLSLMLIVISFLIPTIVITWFHMPVFITMIRLGSSTDSTTTEPVPAYVKRRILDSPLVTGFFGFLGWVIGIASINVLIHFENIKGMSLFTFDRIIFNILMGTLVFVLVYYLLELLNRKVVIPRIFRDKDLTSYAGPLSLSIRGRFIVLYIAISVFPAFLFYFLLKRQRYVVITDNYSAITALSLATIMMITFLLIQLIANYYERPLMMLRNMAESIGNDDFSRTVEVTSSDELGFLSERMNDMSQSLQEKELIKETFGRIVDPKIRDYILSSDFDSAGELVNASVLFVDIRSFTTLSEKLDAPHVVKLLNIVFEELNTIISSHGGLINKFIGDAIMAIFGVPVINESHPGHAVNCAIDVIRATDELNNRLKAASLPAVSFTIGIHTGDVMAGRVGASNRMEYSVIGDVVNTASRLQGMCKEYSVDILVSGDTVSRSDSDLFTSLGEGSIRGKDISISLFTLKRSVR